MITVLSEQDIARAQLADRQICAAVEAGLAAQARGSAIAAPTTVFQPSPGSGNSIAVIRGALPEQSLALIKTVGGFPGNADRNLKTNPGYLALIETETGQVTGLLPAATLTTNRTAMVSAVGAVRLARPGARIAACIGTGGIAAQSIRNIVGMVALDEIRLYGRDPVRTKQTALVWSKEFGVHVRATQDWISCLDGADLQIIGAALQSHSLLYPNNAFCPGAVVIAYGAYSAFSEGISDHYDRLVMDRWASDGNGSLGPQNLSGEISETDLSALIGEEIAGGARARTASDDRILFVHRGVAACDLKLAQAYLTACQAQGLGAKVPF